MILFYGRRNFRLTFGRFLRTGVSRRLTLMPSMVRDIKMGCVLSAAGLNFDSDFS